MLKDGNYEVDRKTFDAVVTGSEDIANAPEVITTWGMDKYFTSADNEVKFIVKPIDKFQPVIMTATKLIHSEVIHTGSTVVDALCKFEIQGDSACERKESDVINVGT
ncbi:hypothetical protein [Pseudoalteromonas sp. GB56]